MSTRVRPAGRLFWKFFLSILLAQVAAAVGIGSYFWLREQARLSHSVASIETGPPAGFLLDASAVALKYGGMPALREMIKQMTRHTVYVVDPSGRELLGRAVPPAVLAQARRELGADRPFRPVRELTAPGGGRLLAFVQRPPRAGAAAHIAAHPGPSSTPRDTPGGPEFARGDGPRGPFGPGLPLSKPIPLLASVIVSLLFALLLAWYFSRPIRALRNAFEAAAAGDLAPRFADSKSTGGDELNDLGRDFDRMSGRLRALMDGQRRLLHDVSHELRSPLARLQAAIGLAHQQPDKIATSLERIERESVRMDKLVGELLTLSRLEANPELPKREPVDLPELVDAIASDVRFEAGPDGPAIEVESAGEVQVHGAPDLLWSAIENVVRNAVKHGGAGGVVTIALHADARCAYVDVLDRGPGIAPADLPTIFQPFARAETSCTNVDGHGLGLAIAERVVHAHGGTIRAMNREDGGLRVSIVLPLSG